MTGEWLRDQARKGSELLNTLPHEIRRQMTHRITEPLTEQQLDAIFLFPYCNQPEVRRTGMEAPWPWLGGTPEPDNNPQERIA